MANFKNTSRYNKRTIDTNRSGKQFIKLRQPLNLKPSEGDTFVKITEELTQRPDLISYRAYGDRSLWWVIYEFNGISDPMFELKTGQILRIPALKRVREKLSETR